jgi:phosphomethylpyrimidine synthase
MKIPQDVREYAAEHGFSDTQALEEGMIEKAKEFVESGGEIYQGV